MSKNLITNVFTPKNLHTLGQTLCVYAIGAGAYTLVELAKKNNWANKRILSLLDLLSINDHYSTENLIEKDDILVCVTKKDLETMDEQEKANFLALFTYCDDDLVKKFNNYVKNGQSFYLSCVPNIGDGTFHINNVSDSFEYLDMCKNSQKYRIAKNRIMFSYLIVGCAWMAFSFSKTLK